VLKMISSCAPETPDLVRSRPLLSTDNVPCDTRFLIMFFYFLLSKIYRYYVLNMWILISISIHEFSALYVNMQCVW